MTRLGKWIRRNQSYSNPLFGTMVILAGMIFPVFHASAAIEEPVQPMAQTAEQVVDALNTVEAGLEVDKAFNVQPVLYRDLVSHWKAVYEELFQVPFPPGGDAYLLDLEINSDLANFIPFQGHTSHGEEFEIEFIQLVEPDYFQDEITDDDRLLLESVSNNSLGVIATVRTANAEIHVLGVLLQWNSDETTRIHEFVILGTISDELAADLRDLRDQYGIQVLVEPVPIEPSPTLTPCQRCQAHAQNEYKRQLGHIMVDLDFALLGIAGLFALRGIKCLRFAAVPLIGTGIAIGCVAVAAGIAFAAILAAGAVADRARRHAAVDLAANLVACCIDFDNCCDGPPV